MAAAVHAYDDAMKALFPLPHVVFVRAQKEMLTCPKCGNEYYEGEDECLCCGYIFNERGIK